MSEASSLRPAVPRPQLTLTERGNRRAKPFGVMTNLSGRVFRNQRHPDGLHAELLERVQLERAGHDGIRMPRRVSRPERLRHRAGVVYDVIEQLDVQVAFDREQMLED